MDSTSQLLSVSVEQQKQDALATILGVCLLIIGLCAFTGITMLCQHLQHQNTSPELAPDAANPRRTPKPVAATTQFRPLGDGLRHRGDLPRQPTLKRDRLATDAALVTPDLAAATETARFSRSSAVLFTSETTHAHATAPPLPPLPSAPTQHHQGPAPSIPATDPGPGPAPAPGGASPQAPSTVKSSTPKKSLDELDIELLSRIDEALASGCVRPEQATQLLKSYGCDLEDLLRGELADGKSCAAARLPSAPVLLSGHRPVASSGAAAAPAASGTDTASIPQPVADPSAATVAATVHGPPTIQEMQQSSGPKGAMKQLAPWTAAPEEATEQVASRGGIRGASAVSIGGTVGGAGGAAVIDDALLVKLDLALASGCVRPEQATQLLKSYGCDLEELLMEELGEEVLGSISRKASSLSL